MSIRPRPRSRALRVALATYAELPLLSEDDRPLIGALDAQGIEARPVVWSDSAADWSSFDAVVIRSTWDYHLRHAEFLRWVSRVEASRALLWNPPDVVRWNTDKRYLADLRRCGVRVADTVFLRRGATPDVRAIVRSKKWKRVVVKPVVSASGYETWTAHGLLNDEAVARVHEMLRSGHVMVQRYLGEISEHGELSLVFLGGKFSHAVVKEAAPGEFRVQPQFGGTSRLVGTRRAIVRAAERILSCVGVPLLYARADGVEVGGELVLMELELVEPSLFLGMEERGFERMARAIRAGVTGIGGKRRA